MLNLIRRSIRRGVEAAGYSIVKGSLADFQARCIEEWRGRDAAATKQRLADHLVRVGVPVALDLPAGPAADAPSRTANDLAPAAALIGTITPWAGEVPRGFIVDFL